MIGLLFYSNVSGARRRAALAVVHLDIHGVGATAAPANSSGPLGRCLPRIRRSPNSYRSANRCPGRWRLRVLSQCRRTRIDRRWVHGAAATGE